MLRELAERLLRLLVAEMGALIVVLDVFLDVSRKEGVLIVQVLMTTVCILVFIVFLNDWLLWNILLICKHS